MVTQGNDKGLPTNISLASSVISDGCGGDAVRSSMVGGECASMGFVVEGTGGVACSNDARNGLVLGFRGGALCGALGEEGVNAGEPDLGLRKGFLEALG